MCAKKNIYANILYKHETYIENKNNSHYAENDVMQLPIKHTTLWDISDSLPGNSKERAPL